MLFANSQKLFPEKHCLLIKQTFFFFFFLLIDENMGKILSRQKESSQCPGRGLLFLRELTSWEQQ